MAAGGEEVNEENIDDNTKNRGPLDELVQYVNLYVRRPVFLSFLVLPFLPLYLFVFYLWILVYGLEDFHFKGLVAIICIVLVHLLTILWCFWSAHVVAFVNCRRVKAPDVKNNTVFAKVVPTSNNGSPRMVRVQKSEFFDGTEIFYFHFRRNQYVWDEDKSAFRKHSTLLNNELRDLSPDEDLSPIEELEDVVVLG